ncbi:MAG: ABC transporter permease subunit, partial [Magnetococcales bacterium]|nr:ABC transporter permease subunit [Magnetococcales bacterium]
GLAVGLGEGGDGGSWQAFGALLGSSVLLGMDFVALAYLISAGVRERATAAGLAIGLWLSFVVLYDLGLLGLLVASKGQIHEDLFPWLLMGNPADIYRLFNLTAFENVRVFSGLAGLSGQVNFPPGGLLAGLVVWLVLPLLGAMALFRRREL